MPNLNPVAAENQIRTYINELTANKAPGLPPDSDEELALSGVEGTNPEDSDDAKSSNVSEPLDQFESMRETQRRKVMMETFLLNQKEKTDQISRYFQLLTNISRQNHDTASKIASNIRA